MRAYLLGAISANLAPRGEAWRKSRWVREEVAMRMENARSQSRGKYRETVRGSGNRQDEAWKGQSGWNQL